MQVAGDMMTQKIALGIVAAALATMATICSSSAATKTCTQANNICLKMRKGDATYCTPSFNECIQTGIYRKREGALAGLEKK
jgi:hypothetical protein